jgi:uridine kinase
LALINGEEVDMPIFNFKEGRRTRTQKVRISAHSPIIIEGIHALNEILTSSIPRDQKFKIYIAPHIQTNLDNHNPISVTQFRLLRRLVRDHKFRGFDAEKTISVWNSVRRGEFKWIYENQEGVDYVFNSELSYELCVMKKHALPLLQKIDKNSEYYITANSLVKFLKYFKDIDDWLVPCNSLLREFIGESCFADV